MTTHGQAMNAGTHIAFATTLCFDGAALLKDQPNLIAWSPATNPVEGD